MKTFARRFSPAAAVCACAVLSACPGVPGLGTTGASPGADGGAAASSRQGPLRTRVVSAQITERGTGTFLLKAEAEVEVADAAGKPVTGLTARFFRFYLSPLPEDTSGALQLPAAYSTPAAMPMASPTPYAVPTQMAKYAVQLSAADMQQLPALPGEVDSLEDLGAGRYKVLLTFKSPPRSYSSSFSIPSDWKVSLAAVVGDDSEAGRVSNWDQMGLGGPGAMATPAAGLIPGRPGPTATPGGFPSDARLTGRVTYGSYLKSAYPVTYRSTAGATASVAAIPDYYGNFYFRAIQDGEYQIVLDAALAAGYVSIGATPRPDVPLPLPTYPAVSTGSPYSTPAPGYHPVPVATAGPSLVPPPGYYGPANFPVLYVSDPVTVPATPSPSQPQVTVDLASLPGVFGTTFIRTSTELFANFNVGVSPDARPATADFRIEVSDASGSVVATTATASASPVFWDVRDASGSVLPAGIYTVQLVYWKRGGTYGGANFFGRSTPQRVVLY